MKKEQIGLLKPYGFSLKLQQIDRAIKKGTTEKLWNCSKALWLLLYHYGFLGGAGHPGDWQAENKMVFYQSLLISLTQVCVKLCLCLPVPLFPHVKSLSPRHPPECVCVLSCVCAHVRLTWKAFVSYVDGTGSIEHFCCWPLIADGLSCEPQAIPLFLRLSRSVTTLSSDPGLQSQEPVKGLLWQHGDLLCDRHDVAWKEWLTHIIIWTVQYTTGVFKKQVLWLRP